MSVEEKLKSVQEAAERIRQIDLDSNKEKKIIYKNLKEELNASATLEPYLWDCVVLGLRFCEYDIEKIFKEEERS
ncbi:hypothetical protein OAG19_00450 [Akkermansiaceae bacterium]|nr:hypothetical protein [Akkermansiaceae bacterium]